jgi:hypothetical protein
MAVHLEGDRVVVERVMVSEDAKLVEGDGIITARTQSSRAQPAHEGATLAALDPDHPGVTGRALVDGVGLGWLPEGKLGDRDRGLVAEPPGFLAASIRTGGASPAGRQWAAAHLAGSRYGTVT